MRIEDLVVELSKDPFNPELNFKCALEYNRINQTASAVSFYLRTAEYGDEVKDKEIIYMSLLKMALCFEDQTDRQHTVINCWRQALIVDPHRPEAYFLMSQHYERQKSWQEAYMWAEMGLRNLASDLPEYVGYPGIFALEFEKAVAGYWIGRYEECISLFKNLLASDIPETYKESVKGNLRILNVAF